MRNTVLVLAVAALTLVGIAAAGADTVVVTPGNMVGWTVGLEQGGVANPPVAEMIGDYPAAPPAGAGSLHLHTRYDDSNQLQKVYFGTNDYSGVALSSITSLKFWTYLAYRDYSTGLPPMFELMADSGTTAQQRRYWFVPNASAIQVGVWQEWDLTASGNSQGYWMLMNSSSTNYKGDWAWLKGRYGSGTAKLQTPYVGDYTSPLDAQLRMANQSGTSISFKIGAGKAIIGGTEANMYNNGDGAWWQTSCSINGYVDKFTIGIDGVETVYDFEPVPEPSALIALATGCVGLLGLRRRVR